VTGEGEKHFIQGRAAQADVIERDVALGEDPHGIGQPIGAVDDAHRDASSGLIDVRFVASELRQQLACDADIAGVRSRTSIMSCPA
jgi:hypothetical protein